MLDITNRVVSIDLAIGEVGAGMLCFSHAERIVVPRGWTLVDNRTVRPPLFDGERYEVPAPAVPLPPVEVATPLTPKRRDRKRRSALPGAAKSIAESMSCADVTDYENGQPEQFDLRSDTAPAFLDPREVSSAGRVLRDDIEVVVDVTVDEGEYDGQYDLPAEYRDTALVDIEEPDRTASPLLARAFDMTRTKRR